MALLDMIEQAAGSGALQQIGARVGLDPAQLQNVIGSLAPALGPKLAEHAGAGGLDQAPAAPPPGSDEAEDHGNGVLGSIFGSKDASRQVAADASAQTGIGVDKIKAVLPQLASVAIGALVLHKASQGEGALGGLLGSLGRA